MSIRRAAAVIAALTLAAPPPASAQSPGPVTLSPVTLSQVLQRVLNANPRLTVADRDIGMSEGRWRQAGALPNPTVSLEVDNALGSSNYRGLQAAETTLQLSQLIELGGKRDARVAAAQAGYDTAHWQRAAVRLELLSDAAMTFVGVLGAQRRVQLLDKQIAALDRLAPLMQRRVEAGASSPADVARTQVAIDFARLERERAKTALAGARRDLAAAMGLATPDFGPLTGDFGRIAKPPAFQAILQAIEGNPQLMRWTAVRAQRDAELLSARLKNVPDVQASIGWRHYGETADNALRLGVAVPIPVLDRNQGGIREAQEAALKTEAERAANKLALTAIVGRAYDTLGGALQEIDLVRRSALPNARKALEAIESGYGQGRFTLLDLLDAYRMVIDAELREQDALTNFHTGVATIEGLTGSPLTPAGGRAK
ncbi:MAG TPA: TolC family protein [Reyranella sp.]|jgi:cobalt-zinc-cadmium efflux system outer membrane protein|nr:TolC family protein [Reyranella sp.]